MTTINLKDFYAWYTHDEYIEVSDEVAAELKADKLSSVMTTAPSMTWMRCRRAGSCNGRGRWRRGRKSQ